MGHQIIQAKNLEVEELKLSLNNQIERVDEYSKQANDAEKALGTGEEMANNHKENSERLKLDIEEMRNQEICWKTEKARMQGEMETLKMTTDNTLGQMNFAKSETKRMEGENIQLQN